MTESRVVGIISARSTVTKREPWPGSVLRPRFSCDDRYTQCLAVAWKYCRWGQTRGAFTRPRPPTDKTARGETAIRRKPEHRVGGSHRFTVRNGVF